MKKSYNAGLLFVQYFKNFLYARNAEEKMAILTDLEKAEELLTINHPFQYDILNSSAISIFTTRTIHQLKNAK